MRLHARTHTYTHTRTQKNIHTHKHAHTKCVDMLCVCSFILSILYPTAIAIVFIMLEPATNRAGATISIQTLEYPVRNLGPQFLIRLLVHGRNNANMGNVHIDSSHGSDG